MNLGEEPVYDPRSYPAGTDDAVSLALRAANHNGVQHLHGMQPGTYTPAPPAERTEIEQLRSTVAGLAEKVAYLEHGMRHVLRTVFPTGIPMMENNQ